MMLWHLIKSDCGENILNIMVTYMSGLSNMLDFSHPFAFFFDSPVHENPDLMLSLSTMS